MSHDAVAHLPPFGPKSEYLNVVIETPGGSTSKFKYDETLGLFMFDKTLPLGICFPYPFGFIPSTKGEDGDPLDVLVITDEPTFVGCGMHAKLLGVIEAEQIEAGKTERNDRFIAIPLEVKTGRPPSGSIERLDSDLSRRIIAFFTSYNKLESRQFKTLRCSGAVRAARLVRDGSMGSSKRKAHHPRAA